MFLLYIKTHSYITSNAAFPDVEIHDVDETWDFILLASDGIWDVLSNDDVVKLCLKKMEKGIPPEQICEEIMTECLSPDLLMTGTDNMTIVLICFLHKETYEDFCKRAGEYCLRLFPDDEKFQEKNSPESQFQKCENGLASAAPVISQNEVEFEDSSSNSDEDQANIDDKKNGSHGDEENKHPITDDQTSEGKTSNDIIPTQDSKKFKEEDAEAVINELYLQKEN